MLLTMQDSLNAVTTAVASVGSMKASIDTVSDSLRTLGATLNTKIDVLSDRTGKLSDRVEEVNVSITEDLRSIEKSLGDDIKKLQNENSTIRETIGTDKEYVDSKIEALEKELFNTHIRMDREKKKFVSLEKSCHRHQQHGRGWNIEIDGIPANVGDEPDQLLEAVMEICKGINVDIEYYEVDTVHRLPSKNSPKPVIVRFVTRESVRAVHKNKSKLKDLEDLHIDIAGLNGDSRIFIRPSLSPYFNNLAFNCRVLKRKKLIKRAITSNDGRLSIQKNDDSYVKIQHESDLTKIFPDFEHFKFDYDPSNREENDVEI